MIAEEDCDLQPTEESMVSTNHDYELTFDSGRVRKQENLPIKEDVKIHKLRHKLLHHIITVAVGIYQIPAVCNPVLQTWF
jgi:hypothetical protein